MKRAREGIQRLKSIAAFVFDERGQMTILSLIFFVMLMAVAGLAVDMGRLYSLQGQIQSYVDVTALASATQLDGQSNAICRAISAAVGPPTGGTCTGSALVTGQQYFAAGSHQLSVQQLMFLSALAPDPGARAPTPVTGNNGDVVVCTVVAPAFATTGCPANADKTAKFVEVRDSPEQISFLILPVMKVFVGNAVTQETLGLKATAGYRSFVCDITPLMICNPSEPAGNTNTLFPYTPAVGQQILMKAGGSGSQWAPGDFGLVSQPSNAGGSQCTGGGANAIRCELGLVSPLTQCNPSAGIDIQPGTATTVSDGLNVRFDIYTGSMSSNNNNSAFAPSVNVTKGICEVNGGSGNCRTSVNNCALNSFNIDPSGASQQLVRMPRDTVWDATGRFGTGVWPITAYWLANHGSATLPPTGVNGGLSLTSSRYNVYRYEIDNNLIPNKSGASGENGGPICSSPGINNANRDRRTLIMSVVNCIANGTQGSQSGVPVVAYVKMFLTEPAGLDCNGYPPNYQGSQPLTCVNNAPTPLTLSGNVNNMFGEVVGVVKPGDKTGVLHQSPALYR